MEWVDAWKTYSVEWIEIQERGTSKVSMDDDHNRVETDMSPLQVSEDRILWLVKSGRWENVNTDNVKTFFPKAAPMPVGATEGEEMFG